jgi:hypothetical protein
VVYTFSKSCWNELSEVGPHDQPNFGITEFLHELSSCQVGMDMKFKRRSNLHQRNVRVLPR